MMHWCHRSVPSYEVQRGDNKAILLEITAAYPIRCQTNCADQGHLLETGRGRAWLLMSRRQKSGSKADSSAEKSADRDLARESALSASCSDTTRRRGLTWNGIILGAALQTGELCIGFMQQAITMRPSRAMCCFDVPYQYQFLSDHPKVRETSILMS